MALTLLPLAALTRRTRLRRTHTLLPSRTGLYAYDAPALPSTKQTNPTTTYSYDDTHTTCTFTSNP
ncbi:MAG: hypothetical protein WD708_07315, partial [Kiritimatiellia bacterium]